MVKQIVAPQSVYDTVQNTQIRFLDLPLLGVLWTAKIIADIDIIDGVTGLPLTTASSVNDEAYKVSIAGLSSQISRNVEVLLNNTPY
jgi:hypothetical protein